MKTLTITEAQEWIENAIENELVFGLRGDDFCPKVNFNNSCVWDDGNKTEEELEGLCAMQIKYVSNLNWAVNELKKYGENIYIIIGESFEEGNDHWADEIIIKDFSIYAKIV